MEWFLERGVPPTELRHEIRDYLARHAADTRGIADADVVVAELLTNVTRHAGSAVWVSLQWEEERPLLTVRDVGPGFAADGFSAPADPDTPHGRGLWMVSRLAEDLQVAMRQHAGTTARAHLPVRRRIEPAPRTHRTVAQGAVPVSLHGGHVTRDSFLVALVARLAQVVEQEWGPDEVARAVATVGQSISPQMEDDFRRANGIVGAMSPDQAAACLVSLKHAIEGDFYVVDVDEHRVTLGNRRCPFGDVVTTAPSLCQVTSSVFGGVAARNFGSASVLLEERIAVGDPECRVTVWFGDPPEASMPFAQGYQRDPTASG